MQLRWPNFKHIGFSHYARLEQQIDYFNNNWDFGLRARYMLARNITFKNKNRKIISSLYFPFHIELFWNLDKSAGFNDVIRLAPGIGYVFDPKWKMEFSTSYHKRRFSENENFVTNDIVFRLRIYHSIF